MPKVRYDDGTVINFDGDPTDEDIEDAYNQIKGVAVAEPSPDLEKAREAEIAQKQQAAQAQVQEQQAKQRQALDVNNWSSKQLEQYYKQRPPKTVEEQAQMNAALQLKKQQEERLTQRMTGPSKEDLPEDVQQKPIDIKVPGGTLKRILQSPLMQALKTIPLSAGVSPGAVEAQIAPGRGILSPYAKLAKQEPFKLAGVTATPFVEPQIFDDVLKDAGDAILGYTSPGQEIVKEAMGPLAELNAFASTQSGTVGALSTLLEAAGILQPEKAGESAGSMLIGTQLELMSSPNLLALVEYPFRVRYKIAEEVFKEVQAFNKSQGKNLVIDEGAWLRWAESKSPAELRQKLAEVRQRVKEATTPEAEVVRPEGQKPIEIKGPEPEAVAPTPSEVAPEIAPTEIQPQAIAKRPEVKQAMSTTVKARATAINFMIRELRTLSKDIKEEHGRVLAEIKAEGGISPTKGDLFEEIKVNVPRELIRREGMAIDEMADILHSRGFLKEGTSDALINYLSTFKKAEIPTAEELRARAEAIIDSELGNPLVRALETQKAVSPAISKMVKDVRNQVEAEIKAGKREISGLLREAERKALTPAQIARLARSQREEIGATVEGPRGGVREAPLSKEDIAQVEKDIGGVVPRKPEISGQPPRIPRTEALVPAEFAQHKFNDLTEFQASPISGLDPRRAFDIIDGKPNGPARRMILDPAQEAAQLGRADAQRRLQSLNEKVPNLRSKTEESSNLFDFIENEGRGEFPIDKLTPRILRAAAEMRENYDELLQLINKTREAQGKVLIQRRSNYITHIQMLNFLDEFYYGLSNIPDDALSMAHIPTRPNAPFFQWALKRLGGPHAHDAVEAYKRYVRKTSAVIHHAPALQATRPLVDFLPGKAQGYVHQYLDEVLALKRPRADVLIPRPLLKAVGFMRKVVGRGAILGNLSSVFNQMWTIPATVSKVGPFGALKAGLELGKGTAKDIVNNLVKTVDPRAFSQSVLDFQKPSIRDFIYQNSPLLQNRRFEIEFDPAEMKKVDKILGALIQTVDHEMVSLAWLAQFRKSSAEGKAFSEAVREAEDTAFKTQSGYTPEDLPPAFRSQFLGALAQFQNSVNNVFNYLRFDVGLQPSKFLPSNLKGHVKDHPEIFKQALLFFGSALALKMLYDYVGIPSAVDDAMDLVPLWGMAEYGPPAVWAGPQAIVSTMTADTPLEEAKAKSALIRAGSLLVPGGNQIRKTITGIIGASKGGKFDKRGRLIFPITGDAEKIRAALFGIYGTKAGQAYVKGGFKPVPHFPEPEPPPKKRLKP